MIRNMEHFSSKASSLIYDGSPNGKYLDCQVKLP